MAFPDLCYSSINYTINPEIKRTEYHSKNTRQRFLRPKRDDLYQVSVQLDTAGLNSFEAFMVDEANNGADEFQGPYYDGLDRTGTLQIIRGQYQVNYLAKDWWNLSYSFEVKDRDLTDAENIYDFINDYGGFDGLSALFDALEQLVNYNELNA